jgi:hypothetical protein
MSIENANKINRLLQDYYPGKLYFSSNLKQFGYSDQLLKQYRNSGWLQSLAKGVMYRTGDKLLSFPALACYNRQTDDKIHIAAHSALELKGFNHYIPIGKPVLMIGYPKQQTIPDWMKENSFDRTLKFFTTATFTSPQLSMTRIDGLNILASAPEQAFLECLLLSPRHYTFMDLYYIMEQLTTFRPEIVQGLLETTNSLKIKRLFLFMAEKAGHYWFNLLDTSKIDLGTAKHQLVKNGVYVSKYKITVPKELYDYE